MKLLICLPLLALLNLNAAGPVGSAADGAPLTQEPASQKPWLLLIACAEMKTPPPKNPGSGGSFIVNKEFLSFAKLTTVAVGANDSGTAIGKNGMELQYRLKKEKDQKTFSLNLQLKAKVGGIQEINSTITIPSESWVIIGLTSREETRKLQSGETAVEKLYYSVAVKITHSEQAK